MILPEIDNIHDALYAQVASALENHYELDDNIDISNNSDKKLKLGFAIEWRNASRESGQLDCEYALNRTVIITNTIQNAASDGDRPARKQIEKDIMNNQINLIKIFESDPNLVATVNKIEFESDNGIEEIYKEQKAYLMIQSTFSIKFNKLRG